MAPHTAGCNDLMDEMSHRTASVERHEQPADASSVNVDLHNQPVPVLRAGIAGILMGLANLVPGISGGTMILIMGLYDRFIGAVADATRLKFSKSSILLLGIIGIFAVGAIGGLSGSIAELVLNQRVLMYSLFIGMTLGGGPLLYKMAKPWTASTVVALIAGIALMFVIAFIGGDTEKPTAEEKQARKEKIERGEYELKPAYGLDIGAGILGMSAMVLPGISGAYMLLILGRYEQILSAISIGKDYVFSFGKSGDITAFYIIIPVGIGVVISLIGVTNLLKWLLKHYERATIGFLLGIVIGSALTLLRVVAPESTQDYAIGAGALVGGFVATVLLERISGATKDVASPTGETTAAA